MVTMAHLLSIGKYTLDTDSDDNRTSETMSLDNTNITSSNVTLTAFAGAPNTVTVSQSQTGLLGAGNKIYDSSGTFIDTVASVNGTQITLSNTQSSITSTYTKSSLKRHSTSIACTKYPAYWRRVEN